MLVARSGPIAALRRSRRPHDAQARAAAFGSLFGSLLGLTPG
jgi:hypothetical protein